MERLRAESRAIAEAMKAGDSATARAMVIAQLRGMYSDAGIGFGAGGDLCERSAG